MIKNTVLNNELNKSVRQITGRVKLYLDDTLVNTFSHNTNLISFDIERIGDENKFFGYGVCQKVNVKVIDREHIINPTTAQHLRIYFNDVRTSPKFYVTEVHRDEKTGEISITAYDKIYFLNNSTVSQLALSTSYTIKQFAQAVGSHSGMQVVFPIGNAFDTNYPNGANFDGTETLRDALDDVAEATSTIYYINHEDKIVFKQLSGEPVLTIDKSKYFDLSSKTNRRLVKIVHVTELGDNVGASLSETGSVQYIRNNAFWDLRDDIGTLVNQSLDRIGGFTINQFECEWRGNPLLEIGDSISIITKNNESVFSNVLNDTISYDGSLSEKTSFTYENEEETEEDNPSDLGEALSQTFARVDKVNKEITLLASDVSDNKSEISEIKQNVDNISLSIKSTVQEVVKGEIGSVSLNVYTIVLSNEAQTIAVNNDRFPLTNETFTTDVQVYEGSNIRTDYEIGDIASANGIKVSKTNSRVSFAVSTSSALTADNGAFTIPIKIDGKTFNKTFSWSCSKQGNAGVDGANAKSVTVTGEQVFKYSNNFTGKPTPETIILKAVVLNTTEQGKWQYMETDGAWTDYTKGGTLVTSKIIDIVYNSKIFGTTDAKSMRLRYFISDSLYDEITLVKISDGRNGTNGKDGIDGVNSYFYIRYSSNPTGSEMTELPNENSKYLGTCSTTSPVAPSSYTEYKWSLIKGTDGADGTTIVNIKEQYYLSTSQTMLLDGEWQDTAPTWVKGKYIWTRTVFSYNNNTTSTTEPICVTGRDGNDGLNGGVSVSKVDVYYYQSTSATELTGGEWKTVSPVWQNGKYVWSKTVTYLDNGTQYESKPICLTGQKGDNGTDGIPGKDGVDGKTTYLHIKYSDDGTTFTDNNGETIGTWIGTYVDFNEKDSTNFNDYTWKKYVGADGTNGKDGYTIILTNEAQTIPTNSSRVPLSSTTYSTDIIVYRGTTQRTDYTIGTIKSANGITVDKTASRVNFTVSSGTALSVDNGTFTIPITIDGKTFNKVFSWSCSKQGNKGDNGADAMAVSVTGEQVFKYANNFTGTPTPETIPLTVTRINTTASGKWQYMDENSAWQDFTKGETVQTGNTLNVSYNSKIFGTTSAKSMRVRYYISNTVYDEITLVKVSDGTNGTNGKDSYTVVLTNENHSFLAGSGGNISTETSTTTKVYAYKGATPVAFTLGTITAPTGMTITDNLATGGRTITFTVSTGTSLADSGTIEIPVIVDGTTYTKTFSWSKALKGAQGNAGAPAKALNIHATSQIFRSLDGNTYEPSTITLTAKCENITFSKWQYSLDGSNFVDVVNDEHGMNVSDTDLVVSHSSDLFSDNMSSIVFKALATDEAYYDIMTIVKVKDLSEDLKDLEGEVIKNQDVIASLQLNTDSINASVQRVEETFITTVDGIKTNISSLTEKVNATMSAEDVKIEIQKEMANGVDKVSTSTGFTFDDNGLKVSKSDSEMSTQITEDGMKIYKNSEVMLTANNQGVDAKNLHATTYLIIGGNSRMEDFTCDGTKRTAVFWIGSDN